MSLTFIVFLLRSIKVTDIYAMLDEPRFPHRFVLEVTGVENMSLQNWVRRGAIKIAEPNPGRGKVRHYSALEVIQIAILRRTDELNISLEQGRDLALAVVETYQAKGEIEWTLLFRVPLPNQSTSVSIASSPRSMKYSPIVATDFCDLPACQFLEPFEGVVGRRRIKTNLANQLAGGPHPNEGKIDPDKRDSMARMGIHAEPVILFPVGEIVNALELRLIDYLDGENQ